MYGRVAHTREPPPPTHWGTATHSPVARCLTAEAPTLMTVVMTCVCGGGRGRKQQCRGGIGRSASDKAQQWTLGMGVSHLPSSHPLAARPLAARTPSERTWNRPRPTRRSSSELRCAACRCLVSRHSSCGGAEQRGGGVSSKHLNTCGHAPSMQTAHSPAPLCPALPPCTPPRMHAGHQQQQQQHIGTCRKATRSAHSWEPGSAPCRRRKRSGRNSRSW